MADQKVSDLPSLNGADVDAADLLYIVDSSAGAAGSKKITIGQYQLAPVSGGTANTVVYLNGSKVESSSSALTFDGTNLGIGTSSPVAKLTVNGNQSFSNTTYQIGYALNTETGTVAGANSPFYGLNMATFTGFSGNGIGLHGYYGLLFSTAGTEKMRLDSSGNLGIGTSSPGVRVDASGQVRALEAGTGSGNGGLIGSTASADGNAGVLFQTNSASRWNLTTSGTAGANLRIYNYALASTIATFDSSGNLGLGVTPSAWGSSAKALTIRSGGSGIEGSISNSGATNAISFTNNAYYNSGWKYVYSGGSFAAGRYDIEGSQHAWYTAPSGTAGNTITFTQAMTLDASGDLLVGTTTTSGGRATISAVANYGDLATGYSLVLANSTGTGTSSNPQNIGVIQFGNPTLTNSDEGRISVVQETPSASTASSMRFFTNGGGGNAQTLERARITSGGDLLVGKTATTNGEKFGVRGSGATSVPTNLSDLNGALALVDCSIGNTAYGAFGFQSAGGGGAAVVLGRGAGYDTNILFCTNPSGTTVSGAMTERARITSGGDFCRGQTTPGNENSRGFYSDTAGYFGQNHLNTDASGSFYAYFGFNGGTIGSITQSGTTAVLFNTTSDARLKTNIVDAPDAAALIDSIQVRSFDWIADGSHQRYGMVAQELAAVAPEAVHTPLDPDEMMAVDYSKLVPMLIKEIQSLRARVAVLESK